MPDEACVRLLQWALPRLGLRWAGFRKPRRQVCRRITARATELGLPDLDAYRARLEADPAEWDVLDGLCRVTISRFRRDHSAWDALAREVIPVLASAARRRAATRLRAWSCGCASGEEPVTLSIVWQLACGAPEPPLEVLATDLDPVVLERARRGCWPPAALRELPERWRQQAFEERGAGRDRLCVYAEHQERIRYALHDVRTEAPEGGFDLVLCRNLAFTYFDEALQRDVLARLVASAVSGAALMTGRSERPPTDGLERWIEREGLWRIR